MDSDDAQTLKELFCRFIGSSQDLTYSNWKQTKELFQLLEEIESKLDHIVDENRVLTERIEKLEKK